MTSKRRASPARRILQSSQETAKSQGFALAELREPPWAQAFAEKAEPPPQAPPALSALQVLRCVHAIMAPAGGVPPGWERDILALVQ